MIILFLDINVSLLLFAVFYLIMFLLYREKTKKEQVKIPLKVTKRVKRQIFTICIMYLISIISIFCSYDS